MAAKMKLLLNNGMNCLANRIKSMLNQKQDIINTVSFTGDASGSASFSSGGNKSISLALANSGVAARNYGCPANGICWVPTNRGITSTNAVWTLTAKRAGMLRFFYSGGGEENYDYLTVSIGGSSVLSTKGVDSPYSGYFERSISSGDVVEFKFIEDTSNLYDCDYVAISNLTLGNTNTNFDPITPLNIGTYFTVSNGTYTFVPMMAFSALDFAVDAKGRITSAKNSYATFYTLDNWNKAAGSQRKIVTGTTTIPNSGWTSDTSMPGYNYRKDISITGLTANDYILVTAATGSVSAANKAGLSPVNSMSGAFRVYCKRIPTASVSVGYTILKGDA